MKLYVKISSAIIIPVLSLVDLIGIVLLSICFVIDLKMLGGVTPLDEAMDLGVFESLLSPPLLIFFLFVFGISIIILIVECILKLTFFTRALAKEDYGEYLAVSVFALAEMIVNSIIVFICSSIAVNLDGIYSAETAVIEKGVSVWSTVYVLLAILTILNIVFANICVKEKKN